MGCRSDDDFVGGPWIPFFDQGEFIWNHHVLPMVGTYFGLSCGCGDCLYGWGWSQWERGKWKLVLFWVGCLDPTIAEPANLPQGVEYSMSIEDERFRTFFKDWLRNQHFGTSHYSKTKRRISKSKIYTGRTKDELVVPSYCQPCPPRIFLSTWSWSDFTLGDPS